MKKCLTIFTALFLTLVTTSVFAAQAITYADCEAICKNCVITKFASTHNDCSISDTYLPGINSDSLLAEIAQKGLIFRANSKLKGEERTRAIEELRNKYTQQLIQKYCKTAVTESTTKPDENPEPAPVAKNAGSEKTITVTGTIKDKDGPVIGAGAVIKGTKTGTVSDSDGKFTLENVEPGAQIEISSLGYKTQTVSASTNMNITLELETQNLEGTVVAGTIKDGDKCAKSDQNIINGKYKKSGGTWVCVPTECADGFVIKDGKCQQPDLDALAQEMNNDIDKLIPVYDRQINQIKNTASKNAKKGVK